MMNAVISGRAGKGLLLDGDSIAVFDVEDPSILTPAGNLSLPHLFSDAVDLRFFEDTDHRQATKELEREYDFTCALDLTLILLDSELSEEVRAEASAELEGLLADTGLIERLECVFYAHEFPRAADTDLALKVCGETEAQTVCAFLNRLVRHQSLIREARKAWEAIADGQFGGDETRAEFLLAAVREGLFRDLVLALGGETNVSGFLLKSLRNSSISKLRNHRAILQGWSSSFRQRAAASGTNQQIESEREERPSADREHRIRRQSFDRKAALDNVESQKRFIIEAMQKRDFERANKITDELVEYHLKYGGTGFAVKSLCDLAMEAKERGLYFLQLSLMKRSIELQPDDGWSWAQYGDALLRMNQMKEALDAYEQAETFGENVIARKGRAEILKAMGRLNDSLAAYDEVIEEHPEDVVARNGRAEVLKAMGMFHDALVAYDEVIKLHPENVFAKTGRAEVLKAMGKLDDSLVAYDEVIKLHPENVVARNGRSCVLVAMKRYEEAMTGLPDKNPVTRQDWIDYHVYGMILLRTGNIDKAIRVFEEGVLSNPWPDSREYFCMALGIAWLKQGDVKKASKPLEEVKAPMLQPKANVLRLHSFGESGDHKQAIAVYSDLQANPPRIASDLTDELYRRYISREGPRHSDDWVIERETDMLLLAA